MGLAAYGTPALRRRGAQADRRAPPTAPSRSTSTTSTTTAARRRSFSRRFVDAVRAAARSRTSRIDLATAEGRRYADIAASVQRCSRTCWSTSPARCTRETGLADLCLGGGVALNGVRQRAHPARVGLRAGVRAARARRRRLRARRGAYADRIHFRQPRPRRSRPPASGARRSTTGELGADRRRGRPAARGAADDAALDRARAPTSWPPARIVGWMDGALRARAARARPPQHPGGAARRGDARPAQPRHQVPRGVPPLRARRARSRWPTATSSCRRAGRASAASCRACSRCAPSGARGSAAVTHVDGTARVQTRRAARWRRASTRCCTPTAQRSGVPVLLNTSFNLAGEPIVNRAVEGYSTFRRCGIDVLVAGRAMVEKRSEAEQAPHRWREA